MRIKIKQFHVGPWLGGLKVQAARAQFYVAMSQWGMVAVAAIDKAQEWFPWLTFPMLFCAQMVLYFSAMILDYMFALPSEVDYSSHQTYRHRNPSARDLKELKLNLKKTMKHMDLDYEEVDEDSTGD